MDSFHLSRAELEELRVELFPSAASPVALMEQEPVAVAVLIEPLLLVCQEPLVDSLVAVAVADLPPITASPLALAVLAASARSTSSPTANL